MAPLTKLQAALCAALPAVACAAPEAPGQDRTGTAPVAEGTDGQALASFAEPVAGRDTDYDALFRAMDGAHFLLLGENTHGSHEFYRERGRITDRLIRELDVGAVAVEADWTPAHRVNLYVRGLGSDRTAEQALAGFRNFPRWMWRNAEMRDFVERLRTHNLALPAERRVGFYGMDVYDLYDAADAVVAHLRRVDPAAAARAQRHYRCFVGHARDTQAYGERARRRPCEKEAAAALQEVRRLAQPVGAQAVEEHFAAVRAASSVVAAEEYFRAAYAGSLSWNKRDTRMAGNVEAIAAHVAATSGKPGKVAVWAHNSHIGDARATNAPLRGEINLGQLMHQRHGELAFRTGFFTYSGQVMAAEQWDAPGRVWDIRPAMEGSHSHLLHGTGIPAFSLILKGNEPLRRLLARERQERAIGVVYARATERTSHYFPSRLSERFEALVFFNRTKAVTPLR